MKSDETPEVGSPSRPAEARSPTRREAHCPVCGYVGLLLPGQKCPNCQGQPQMGAEILTKQADLDNDLFK